MNPFNSNEEEYKTIKKKHTQMLKLKPPFGCARLVKDFV